MICAYICEYIRIRQYTSEYQKPKTKSQKTYGGAGGETQKNTAKFCGKTCGYMENFVQIMWKTL